MLRNDNLRLISLALCWFYTNGVIALTIKPDTLDVLLQIPGIKLTNEDLRRYHIWPQGIIPYYIDDFSFDKVLRDRIRSYLDQLNKVTGLHFMEIPQPPEDDDNRWVFFVNRKGQLGCADVAYHNFTYTGVQRVVLGYDCLRSEDLDEIILALVGVPPQHNSPDRDDYITVNLDNIVPDKHYLFKKLQPEEWAFSKLKYDFSSAGHYYTHKYTSNGVETMTLKNRENNLEGSKGLSATDITKIRMLYNYISFKDKELRKVPECSKLFVPGKNFSKYIPSNNSIVNPEINQDVDKKGKGDKEIEDNADDKDEINDEESLKQDNSKEADPNTDNQESKEQFESPDEQKLHTDINKRPKSKDKKLLQLKYDEISKIKSSGYKKDIIEDSKSLNSEEKHFLSMKYHDIGKIESSQSQKLKTDDENSLNSEEKQFLSLKYNESVKIKSPKTKKLKAILDNKSLNSEEKYLLSVKQHDTGKIVSSKSHKLKKDDNKSLNSEEKQFLSLKYNESVKIKSPKTKKLKATLDNKSLNSEEKYFLSVKHHDTGKIVSSKSQKLKKDDNKSLNSEEKQFLLLKYNESVKINSPKTKKLKATHDNKSLNSEEKNLLLLKYHGTDKNHVPEENILLSNKSNKKKLFLKKYKIKHDENKSLNSEEKYFLTLKKHNTENMKNAETQNTESDDNKSLHTNEKHLKLSQSKSGKLKRQILDKSDYQTDDGNIKFHIQ